MQITRENNQQSKGRPNLPYHTRPATDVQYPTPSRSIYVITASDFKKDNNPIMHLTNYKMLYMDKGKSFLIPTETSQCAQIWDLIKPVLLLQMLQLFITFSRLFSIQHGIHIYSLLWLRSPPAQPHAVRHLLWMNKIYWPFCLIFLIQHQDRQNSIAFFDDVAHLRQSLPSPHGCCLADRVRRLREGKEIIEKTHQDWQHNAFSSLSRHRVCLHV